MNADYEIKKQLEPIFMGVFLLHCSFLLQSLDGVNVFVSSCGWWG